MNFPLLLHWQRLNVSCFMQYFMLWSISSDGGGWPHLLHMKCNPEKQRKKQTFVAKMYNCDQFEIKIYLFENCFWNAKYHFMFLHDLNWLIFEMMTQSDKISNKPDSKECHSRPSLPFWVSITYFKAVFIQQKFSQCTMYKTSLRYYRTRQLKYPSHWP